MKGAVTKTAARDWLEIGSRLMGASRHESSGGLCTSCIALHLPDLSPSLSRCDLLTLKRMAPTPKLSPIFSWHVATYSSRVFADCGTMPGEACSAAQHTTYCTSSAVSVAASRFTACLLEVLRQRDGHLTLAVSLHDERSHVIVKLFINF